MDSYEVAGSETEGYAITHVEGERRRRVVRVLRMEKGLARGHLPVSCSGMTQQGAETVARGLRDGTYVVDTVSESRASVT